MKFYYNHEVKVPFNIMPLEKFIKFEEDTYDVLGSVFLEKLNKVVDQDAEVKVLENECRFDVLSHKFMQETDYWWVLMEYNNFIDWDIRQSDSLKIPVISQLMMLEQEMILSSNAQKMT